jgi:hypothetical protein
MGHKSNKSIDILICIEAEKNTVGDREGKPINKKVIGEEVEKVPFFKKG